MPPDNLPKALQALRLGPALLRLFASRKLNGNSRPQFLVETPERIFAQAKSAFGRLLFTHVDVVAEPSGNRTAVIAYRQDSLEEGSKYAIAAFQRKCHLERRPGRNREGPASHDLRQRFGIVHRLPAPTFQICRPRARVFVLAFVVPVDRAISVRHPAQARKVLAKRAIFFLGSAQGSFGLLAIRDIERRAYRALDAA